MVRDAYQRELETLRDDVVAFGERVLDQLDDALLAIASDDEGLAADVVAGDEAINERYLELESDCVSLFALQQPVASDLRLVTTSFKLLTELERVGDLATNLSAYVRSVEDPQFVETSLVDAGELARDMVAEAIHAYESDDDALAEAVIARDDELDGLCERAAENIVRELVELPESSDEQQFERLLTQVNRALLTLRDVERVGDHAVNIAARSFYMTTNQTTHLY